MPMIHGITFLCSLPNTQGDRALPIFTATYMILRRWAASPCGCMP